MGFLDKLKNVFGISEENKEYLKGFSKTNDNLGRRLRLLSQNQKIDSEEFLEELMIALIESDLGYKTAQKVCDLFVKNAKKHRWIQTDVMDILSKTLLEIYHEETTTPIHYNPNGPTVILLVGVNGSGKTTTIAKLASRYKEEGKKVILAAGDTFRAGAVEQLVEWGKKIGVEVVTGNPEQDPSSVLVDAARKAKEKNIDILLCDTAGRLQNKKNLMTELSKMHKVLDKEINGAPQNCWLVLDANTGQNGLSQAELFKEATSVDGIILTKLDGTAKGGIILAIRDILDIPVRFLGLGEKQSDLKEFDANQYLYSILADINHEH